MTYSNMGPAEGGDGLFPQHPKTGTDWFTLKGRMLSPMIQAPLESVAMNRGQVESGTNDPGWNSHLQVDTPLTHGGGAFAV